MRQRLVLLGAANRNLWQIMAKALDRMASVTRTPYMTSQVGRPTAGESARRGAPCVVGGRETRSEMHLPSLGAVRQKVDYGRDALEMCYLERCVPEPRTANGPHSMRLAPRRPSRYYFFGPGMRPDLWTIANRTILTRRSRRGNAKQQNGFSTRHPTRAITRGARERSITTLTRAAPLQRPRAAR